MARDHHRHLLTGHFFLLVIGLGAVFAVNRLYSPERFWAPYVALAWAALFGLHVVVFVRGTMATMGAGRKARTGAPANMGGRTVESTRSVAATSDRVDTPPSLAS